MDKKHMAVSMRQRSFQEIDVDPITDTSLNSIKGCLIWGSNWQKDIEQKCTKISEAKLC